MKLNFKRMVLAVVAVMSIGVAQGFASTPAPVAVQADSLSAYLSARASMLLADVQREAAGLQDNAQTLGTLSYNITWHSHASYLIEVKKHVNLIGKHLAELERIRPLVSPWQQQAIVEVKGHAMQVAASAEAAIAHLRANQERTLAPAYRAHLSIIMGSSEDLKQTVDKFLNYESTQQKFQELQRELEL
jgi:hypothetical protein